MILSVSHSQASTFHDKSPYKFEITSFIRLKDMMEPATNYKMDHVTLTTPILGVFPKLMLATAYHCHKIEDCSFTISKGTKEVPTFKQVSAVADEPPRRAASQQTCCKQRWTLSVINLPPNNACDHRRLRVIASLFVKSCQF